MSTDRTEYGIYSQIASGEGIRARDIAKGLCIDRKTVNHYLYRSPYMRDLCYQDRDYRWHALIRQGRPHLGLVDYSGYYGTVKEFLELTEDEWFEMLLAGCRQIGRNLNLFGMPEESCWIYLLIWIPWEQTKHNMKHGRLYLN